MLICDQVGRFHKSVTALNFAPEIRCKLRWLAANHGCGLILKHLSNVGFTKNASNVVCQLLDNLWWRASCAHAGRSNLILSTQGQRYARRALNTTLTSSALL
ncbi:hypothetical protein ABIE13_002531 [Ottowia thiooxydans]|uniref:Uncharacterized protein n=1 Tax=Ottowia thiooxydans TaxID=219182 RepID=A0ABV2Q8T5_9BURK